MKNTAELVNNISTAFAIMPTLAASIASTLIIGPAGLIAPVLFGSLYYVTRNSLGQGDLALGALKHIEPSKNISEVTQRMGFEETPAMYFAKNQKKFKARAAFNNVIMSENQLQFFDQEEQDFIWAHEFAHIKRGDNKVTSAVYSNVCTNSLSFSALTILGLAKEMTAQNDLLMASSSFAAAAMISAVPIIVKETRSSNHKAEFDCDKRAVLATGNIDSGIRA
jgi:Zn-dependent protease with chaperone function